MKTFYLICMILLLSACYDDFDLLVEHPCCFAVKSGDVIEIDLGGTSIEGYMRIVKEPEHGQISEIKYQFDSRTYSYFYQSVPGFVGTEIVEIENFMGIGDGINGNTSERSIEIVIE